jgi:nucleoside-diphosphate-sugar epimerase
VSRHLVTGGAGFLGSALVRRLLQEGPEVVVLDRFSRGKQERVPDGAEVVKGDVRQFTPVFRAAKGCDTIWHLAYVQGTQTFYSDPKDVIDVALRGILNVLEACELYAHRPDLFLVSSSEVYQNPPVGMFPTDETVPLSVPDVLNPRYSYGGGKIACELAALAYQQAGHLRRAVIARPHNIYGPDMGWDHVIPQFATRLLELKARGGTRFHIQGTGQETRSFCYVDDCVDAFLALHEHAEPRGVYHVGNPGEEYAIGELAHVMAAWFDMGIDVIPGELQEGSPTRRLPDIGKLAALGYHPRWALEDGLPPTLYWYQANYQPAAAKAA